MIENKRLDAIKVGMGTFGRVQQFINSHIEPNYGSDNAGWAVLRIAKFSNSEFDYDIGRRNALEAEKRAHFYWRYVLQEPRHLEQAQMGYSLMDVYGSLKFTPTNGFTETARLENICEQTTWNYVRQTPGFIEEIELSSSRSLILRDPLNSDKPIPDGYKEAKITRYYPGERVTTRSSANPEVLFWQKVLKTESCWNWTGAVIQNGYGVANFDGKTAVAHRVAWTLEIGSDPGLFFLDNICGNKTCVKPEHWKISLRRRSKPGEVRISEFECLTTGCSNPSVTMTKHGYCDRCTQRQKRARRKLRNSENP